MTIIGIIDNGIRYEKKYFCNINSSCFNKYMGFTPRTTEYY